MKIAVGSQNAAKVLAVEETVSEYPHLASAEIIARSTHSGVADQPLSLKETVQGAINRAREVKGENEYGIGIESGLMEVPHTKSGYMDVCAVAVYDGAEFHIGLSSAWEFPDKETTRMIVEGGMNMSQAVNSMGLTDNAKIGQAEGAIGLLTKGRVDRKEYTKQALKMALIHVDN